MEGEYSVTWNMFHLNHMVNTNWLNPIIARPRCHRHWHTNTAISVDLPRHLCCYLTCESKTKGEKSLIPLYFVLGQSHFSSGICMSLCASQPRSPYAKRKGLIPLYFVLDRSRSSFTTKLWTRYLCYSSFIVMILLSRTLSHPFIRESFVLYSNTKEKIKFLPSLIFWETCERNLLLASPFVWLVVDC
jgi:hypothetical protein